MIIFATVILPLASFNIVLALLTLHALLTGTTQVNGRRVSRQEAPIQFWIAVGSRAAAAVVFLCYLFDVVFKSGA